MMTQKPAILFSNLPFKMLVSAIRKYIRIPENSILNANFKKKPVFVDFFFVEAGKKRLHDKYFPYSYIVTDSRNVFSKIFYRKFKRKLICIFTRVTIMREIFTYLDVLVSCVFHLNDLLPDKTSKVSLYPREW